MRCVTCRRLILLWKDSEPPGPTPLVNSIESIASGRPLRRWRLPRIARTGRTKSVSGPMTIGEPVFLEPPLVITMKRSSLLSLSGCSCVGPFGLQGNFRLNTSSRRPSDSSAKTWHWVLSSPLHHSKAIRTTCRNSPPTANVQHAGAPAVATILNGSKST